MKVVLLNGPCTRNFARTGRWQATSRGASLWYPIWLAYATAVLEDAGFDTRLIDAPAYGYDLAGTLEEIKAFAPQLCIIDTSTASITHDLATAKRIKELAPQVKVCLVGPHASALPEEVLSHEQVDFAAVSEYEYTVRELAQRLAKDPETGGEGIAGLYSRAGGKVIKNPPRPLIAELDELPFASRSLFRHLDISRYGLDFTLHPYMNIMTSRGCPAKCIYCLWPQTLSRGKYRERSLDHVFREIDFVLARKPRAREFFFDDDTFTVRKERVVEFCERYKAGKYNLPFSVNARANITDEGLLRLMKEAGLRCLVVGFESGNQAILEAVKKNTRLDEMEEFARLCAKTGIQVHGDFVVGLPGETRETIEQTVRFASGLSLSTFQLSIAHPLPGTEFYGWLDENNYLTTRDYSQWIDEDGMQRCVLNYPELGTQEIEKAVYDSLRKYYLSGRFLLSAAGRIISNPRELRRYLRGGLRLLRFLRRG